jgi:hypothetical protein
MGTAVNVCDVLDGHVALDISCLDRIYLNAYVPKLQTSGGVTWFLREHLGNEIASPALFNKIGERFRRNVVRFAESGDIPILRLSKPDRSRWGDRKIDHVMPYVTKAREDGRFGVVAIVAAQEFQKVFVGTARPSDTKAVGFSFTRVERRVGTYYFYIHDPDFGVGFIKICTYFPYPAKVWVNGHEWAKRQATAAGISWSPLANGFASCSDPSSLQQIADGLTASHLQDFFDRWTRVIPTPLTDVDRASGYWWELSMRQIERSRTIVFDDPRRARSFFESLVQENIGIGRPEEMAIVWGRRVTKATREPFRTRLFGKGTDVKIDFAYKHSRIKQYLKEGRALRIETVINKPSDVGLLARIEHLPELVEKADAVNARLLESERVGQCCAIGNALFERIHQPYAREGNRTGAFRFGDQRAMALAGALCAVIHVVSGFTNKSLRCLVAGLLDADYSSNQMSYDLRRLRLHGLITRIDRTNTYVLTPEGQRVAVFYTKLEHRLLQPLLEADQPPSPPELRRALRTIDRSIEDYINKARMGVLPEVVTPSELVTT